MADVELKIDGIEKLLKALKSSRLPRARIGILGESGQRVVSSEQPAEAPVTNAQVGAFHEFGTSKTPVRSFLRVPLMQHLNERLEKSKAFDKKAVRAVMAAGSLVPWMQKVCVIAEGIVQEAFDTGGFGEWPPSEMDGKKVKQTLVETQQLRNSITSEVKE